MAVRAVPCQCLSMKKSTSVPSHDDIKYFFSSTPTLIAQYIFLLNPLCFIEITIGYFQRKQDFELCPWYSGRIVLIFLWRELPYRANGHLKRTYKCTSINKPKMKIIKEKMHEERRIPETNMRDRFTSRRYCLRFFPASVSGMLRCGC